MITSVADWKLPDVLRQLRRHGPYRQRADSGERLQDDG